MTQEHDTLHLAPIAADSSIAAADTTSLPVSGGASGEPMQEIESSLTEPFPAEIAATDTLPFLPVPTASVTPQASDTAAFAQEADTATPIPVVEVRDGLAARTRERELPFADEGLFSLLAAELVLFLLIFIQRKKIFSWQTEDGTNHERDYNHNKRLTGISSGIRNKFLFYAFLVEGTLAATAFFALGIPLPLKGGYAVNALVMTLPFALYFGVQQTMYRLLAGIFAPDASGREWCDSHIIINLILGLALFPFTLLSAYLPESGMSAIFLAFAFYLIARLFFIGKGVKLFLRNFRSLLYFILYLCALEIAPLLLIARFALLF